MTRLDGETEGMPEQPPASHDIQAETPDTMEQRQALLLCPVQIPDLSMVRDKNKNGYFKLLNYVIVCYSAVDTQNNM